MKREKEFPQADVSPYECALKKKLNGVTSNKILSFGNARVELERYANHVGARIALTQKVDHETFIKVFKENLKSIAKLSRTAQAILWYIMDTLPKDRGHVIIDNATVMDFCGFKHRKSVRDGVIELLDKNILCRSTVPKKYWVNPLIVFNGNRITYAEEYILDTADIEEE